MIFERIFHDLVPAPTGSLLTIRHSKSIAEEHARLPTAVPPSWYLQRSAPNSSTDTDTNEHRYCICIAYTNAFVVLLLCCNGDDSHLLLTCIRQQYMDAGKTPWMALGTKKALCFFARWKAAI
ncbi:unnamed protein product [Ectocarpus sp. 12 AP-2014]